MYTVCTVSIWREYTLALPTVSHVALDKFYSIIILCVFYFESCEDYELLVCLSALSTQNEVRGFEDGMKKKKKKEQCEKSKILRGSL